MTEIRQSGTQPVIQNGTSLAIRPPMEWLSEHELKVKDPVWAVLKQDKIIRYHLTEQLWAIQLGVRKIENKGWLTIPVQYAEKLGISKGTMVAISIDIGGEVLMVRKAE